MIICRNRHQATGFFNWSNAELRFKWTLSSNSYIPINFSFQGFFPVHNDVSLPPAGSMSTLCILNGINMAKIVEVSEIY